jgi:hypothetical protein
MKARQGNTFTPILGGWVVIDYLSSLLKGTEISSIILNFDITGVLVAGVEAIDMLDLIDIKLTRDGNKKLVDCTLGDLQRLGMLKSKTNYGNIATIAALAVQPIEIVIPFEDKARPNPKDTSLIVDTLKSLQLEFRNNIPVLSATIGNVETMQVYETQKTSVRITSDRYLLRQGVVIGGAVQQWGHAIQSALRSLLLINGTLTNLTYLQVDGGNDTIYDGEPDELICFAQEILEANPPGANGCLALPFLSNGQGYGGTNEMPLNLRFTTGGALTVNIFEDYIICPNPDKIKKELSVAKPYMTKADYSVRAVDKNSATMTQDATSKASIIPQVKITPNIAVAKKVNPNTAEMNIEARIGIL